MSANPNFPNKFRVSKSAIDVMFEFLEFDHGVYVFMPGMNHREGLWTGSVARIGLHTYFVRRTSARLHRESWLVS